MDPDSWPLVTTIGVLCTVQFLGDLNWDNLDKAKLRDFYQLLIYKTHAGSHTGPKRWSDNLSLNEDHWGEFLSLWELYARKRG